MSIDLQMLVWAAALTLVQMLVSVIAAQGQVALPVLAGNRNEMPALTGWAGRAARAHANMLESLVVFAIVVLVGTTLQLDQDRSSGPTVQLTSSSLRPTTSLASATTRAGSNRLEGVSRRTPKVRLGIAGVDTALGVRLTECTVGSAAATGGATSSRWSSAGFQDRVPSAVGMRPTVGARRQRTRPSLNRRRRCAVPPRPRGRQQRPASRCRPRAP